MGGGRGRREEGGEGREVREGESCAGVHRVLEGERVCGLVDEAGAAGESKDHRSILREECDSAGNMPSCSAFFEMIFVHGYGVLWQQHVSGVCF